VFHKQFEWQFDAGGTLNHHFQEDLPPSEKGWKGAKKKREQQVMLELLPASDWNWA